MEGYALSDGPAARWDAGRMKGVRKV
jgi:hypothetical protein